MNKCVSCAEEVKHKVKVTYRIRYIFHFRVMTCVPTHSHTLMLSLHVCELCVKFNNSGLIINIFFPFSCLFSVIKIHWVSTVLGLLINPQCLVRKH